jgi:hypothetical protein
MGADLNYTGIGRRGLSWHVAEKMKIPKTAANPLLIEEGWTRPQENIAEGIL